MPTIEIICLEQQTPLELPEFSFALSSEDELISHRGLFYEEFRTLNGCIYHLGNPDRRSEDDWFFADQLVDWKAEDDRLKFRPQFVPEIQQLFSLLVEVSPVQTLIFSSDYQFGPDVRRYQRPLTYETFWRRHAEEKLWLNARYFVHP